MTADLTTFLLERIAEDEEIARAVEPPGRPLEGGRYHSWHSSETGAIGNAAGQVVVYGAGLGDSERAHIAAHDPARVLAQCAALRAVVELHVRHDWLPEGRDECSECGCADCYAVELPCPTLRALASIYADHEGWREEWRLS